jgi:AraC-like DNA-binding protein
MYSFISPRRDPRAAGVAGFYAGVHTHPRPTPLDIHFHHEIEVGLVLSGQKLVEFSDYAHTFGPGEVWLAGIGEPHGFANLTPVRNVLLSFAPESLGEELAGDTPWLTLFTAPPAARPQVQSAAARKRVLAIGQILAEEITAESLGWPVVVRAELLRLLVELRRGWTMTEQSWPPGSAPLAAVARLGPALSLVRASPTYRVTVADAAAACGLSPSHFQSLFRQAMGTSFGASCLRARLSFVAHRLLHSGLPVAAIAQEAGFSDGSHLHRLFARHYGCTPAQFRERRGRTPEAT